MLYFKSDESALIEVRKLRSEYRKAMALLRIEFPRFLVLHYRSLEDECFHNLFWEPGCSMYRYSNKYYSMLDRVNAHQRAALQAAVRLHFIYREFEFEW